MHEPELIRVFVWYRERVRVQAVGVQVRVGVVGVLVHAEAAEVLVRAAEVEVLVHAVEAAAAAEEEAQVAEAAAEEEDLPARMVNSFDARLSVLAKLTNINTSMVVPPSPLHPWS